MKPPSRKSRSLRSIPAALATTRHIEVKGGELRHVERPLVEQLAPTDPLRLSLVAADPEVRSAWELVSKAHSQVKAALAKASATPEGARAHELAVQVHADVVRMVLKPAVLQAEARRKLMLDDTKPDRSAMAAATGRPLDLDAQLAIEVVLRRRPLARDPALWQIPAAGAAKYLRAAFRHEVKRLKKRHVGEEKASERDVEVYVFVEARPRGRQGAPKWWSTLLEEWNALHFDATLLTTRSLQNSYRRGRKAATEVPYDDGVLTVTALEQRAADRQMAREVLEELVAAAELTPATRATLEALERGEETPRWARQDLVAKLRKAAGTKET